MAVLGNLIVNLRANAAHFVGEMEKARAKQHTLQRQTEQLRGAFVSVAKAAIAAAGVAGFGAMIKGSIDMADRLGKLSTRIGVSVEGLSRLKHAAELSGVEFNSLATGLQRMTRRIAEAAQGTGEARAALAELGLSAATLGRQSVEEQFLAISQAMAGIENAGDRVRLAMRIFDTEGVAFLQMMGAGAAGIRELMVESDKFGSTVTKRQAEMAAKVNDAMSRMQAAIQGVANTLAVNLGPHLEAVANFMSQGIPASVEFAILAFRTLRFSMVSVILSTLEFVESVGRSFQNLGPQVQAFIETLAALPGAGFSPMVVIAQKFVEVQKLVGAALDANSSALERAKQNLLGMKESYDVVRGQVEGYEAQLQKHLPVIQNTANAYGLLSDAQRNAAKNTQDLGTQQDRMKGSTDAATESIRRQREALEKQIQLYQREREELRKRAEEMRSFERRGRGGFEGEGPEHQHQGLQIGGGTWFLQIGQYRTRFEDGQAVALEKFNAVTGSFRTLRTRATGGEVPFTGPVMLEAGERVISNSTTFGPININLSGSDMSGAKLRGWVRNELLPELQAARR